MEKICDGYFDCPYGEDEEGCAGKFAYVSVNFHHFATRRKSSSTLCMQCCFYIKFILAALLQISVLSELLG